MADWFAMLQLGCRYIQISWWKKRYIQICSRYILHSRKVPLHRKLLSNNYLVCTVSIGSGTGMLLFCTEGLICSKRKIRDSQASIQDHDYRWKICHLDAV